MLLLTPSRQVFGHLGSGLYGAPLSFLGEAQRRMGFSLSICAAAKLPQVGYY